MTKWLPALVVCATCMVSASSEESSDAAELADAIEEVVVSARATVAADPLAALAATTIEAQSIVTVSANHPNEIMSQAPGIWVSRGSGQEHLTAMRSGVLTGAGACGAFQLLENGIPIRPASFCNVNGLFELNTEQASAIEVIRGPASSRFGGNALHGAINAVTLGQLKPQLGFQLGSDSLQRIDAQVGNETVNATVYGLTTDGWRDDTGFDQLKVTAQLEQGWQDWHGVTTMSLATLGQETAGYLVGLDSYKDEALRTSNPNPEAFRDAYAVRYATHWSQGDWVVTPFLRASSMEFLMHFLPGKPLEENAQRSGGIAAHWERNFGKATYALGLHSEWVAAELSEVQVEPTQGSAFLVATRPVGTHYDFTVAASHVGIFHDARYQVSDQTNVKYRLRIEATSYTYDNLHLDGNTRDDGSTCGFGGCLYTRPADRSDAFLDRSWQVGFERELNKAIVLHGSLGSGFRPPQIAELYRLQSGQSFASIDSERLDALEIGFKWVTDEHSAQVSAYRERSRNLVIRDAEGFNRSGGRVQSSGLEWQFAWRPSDKHGIRVTQSLGRHRYAFSDNLARREVIVKGNEVDTAPRLFGSLDWTWRLHPKWTSTLELVHIGSYFMDAANTFEYPGHVVVHWHGEWRMNDAWKMQAHLRNVLDRRYADRADWSFGNPRYFPAMPRNAQVGFTRYF
ncbi:MAG: TonB-dependent receptor [Gammaproteobacteria bacterium]|nr:TonB-dependent receptor [Gammaproteobacteria bacterium]